MALAHVTVTSAVAPPASTRKNASMSASVAVSPSPLKSAELVQGAGGKLPARQEKKNASMSASVPVSPSQLKSALRRSGRTMVSVAPWAS